MDNLSKIKTFIKEKFSVAKKNTFEAFYNSGIDSFNRKDYEKAIKFFKQALEQEHVRPQVHYNIGLTYQSMKDYDLAVASYKKFLEANPEDYDGLYNIALAYFKLNNYPKAIEYFKTCLEIKSEDDVIKALVIAHLCNNEVQEAYDLALSVLNTNQDKLDLFYQLARIFEGKNATGKDFTLIDKAIEMYLKILERDMKYFDAYLQISICFAKKGEWEMSVEFCNKALGMKPDSYEANNQMGLVHYCSGEVKKAITFYETAMKLKPEGDYKVYSNLAYAYEKIAQYDKAIKIFTKLLSKFHEFPAKEEIKNHLRVLKTL